MTWGPSVGSTVGVFEGSGVIDGTALGFSAGAVFVSTGATVTSTGGVLIGSVGAMDPVACVQAESRMDRSRTADRRVLMGFPPWGMWMR